MYNKFFKLLCIKRNYYEKTFLYTNERISMKIRIYKQNELKYLSNFRKINQTRFYKKCESK